MPHSQDTKIDVIRNKTNTASKETIAVDEIVEEENDDRNNFVLSTDTKFELLESGVFVCAWSEPGALEDFYLVKVIHFSSV